MSETASSSIQSVTSDSLDSESFASALDTNEVSFWAITLLETTRRKNLIVRASPGMDLLDIWNVPRDATSFFRVQGLGVKGDLLYLLTDDCRVMKLKGASCYSTTPWWLMTIIVGSSSMCLLIAVGMLMRRFVFGSDSALLTEEEQHLL